MICAGLLVSGVQTGTSVQSQIKKAYQTWDSAYLAHDVKTLAGLLHPKFVMDHGSGRTSSRADYVQRLWKAALPEQYTTVVQKIQISGNQASVWTSESLKTAGNPIRSHQYKDTWMPHKGKWLLVKSQTVGGH
jgi:ketosteroid isomerase-like protein